MSDRDIIANDANRPSLDPSDTANFAVAGGVILVLYPRGACESTDLCKGFRIKQVIDPIPNCPTATRPDTLQAVLPAHILTDASAACLKRIADLFLVPRNLLRTLSSKRLAPAPP